MYGGILTLLYYGHRVHIPPTEDEILTEDGFPILTESDSPLLTED
jgi:hypothetical protein